jgi:RND family efflux transporter MFP subunit
MKRSLPLTFSALAVAALTACTPAKPSAQANQPRTVKVKVADLAPQTVTDRSEFVANLQSRRSVTLQPQVEGQVSRILVQAGDPVTAGTPLLLINPLKQQASVASSTAAAASSLAQQANAQATLKTYAADRLAKQADVKFNQQQYDRYAKLQAQGAISKQELDRYANSLAAAQANLAAVDARIEAQKAEVASTQRLWQQSQASTQVQREELQFYTITAPFAGMVGNIPVKVGDAVNKDTKLITVTQNQPLEVNVSIPVDRAAAVQSGTSIQLLNGQGQVIGTSRVFFVAPNVDTSTQSVLVKALADNSGNQLRADQQVRARVIWQQQSGLVVPTVAVSRIAGQPFVFVAETDPKSQALIARQKPVKLGQIQGNAYQVLEGLQPGEVMIVSGIQNLSDRVPIETE